MRTISNAADNNRFQNHSGKFFYDTYFSSVGARVRRATRGFWRQIISISQNKERKPAAM